MMRSASVLVAFAMLSVPLSGCLMFQNDRSLEAKDLSISLEYAIGGEFQEVELGASLPLSVYIPYLVKDPVLGFIQNSTVIDIDKGEVVSIEVLAPPRASAMAFIVGEIGRMNWPVRMSDESWESWFARGGANGSQGAGVERTNSDWVPDYTALEVLLLEQHFGNLNSSFESGGAVLVKWLPVIRPMNSGADQGGAHSSGLLHGKGVYDRLFRITDPSNSLDPVDGKEGYWDRWAGQGNPAYEDAAQYLIQELGSFGLEVMAHRFEFTDIFGNQNPESYNICGYKWGSVYPDEWLVFGAHFDVAPPANLVMLDPHVTGSRTYGTRAGAYDNSAGTSMVLETAGVLSEFNSRRTMVFCLWSGEEGGKRGSDYWTEYYVKEDNPAVTVTNYINLDMAGVNWPGGGGAPHGDPDPQIDEDGYPKDDEIWPMRVYIGPGPNHDIFNQPEMVGLSSWIGSDALGLEKEMGTLLGVNYTADTWKTNAWIDAGRPEVIVYEDTTARSDHASFQDNLGTVTVGFGGLVDGYWCYHQTCDTLEEMEAWMDTTGKGYGEDNTGVSNLANSLDMITWWALLTFFHCDESPVLNAIS